MKPETTTKEMTLKRSKIGTVLRVIENKTAVVEVHEVKRHPKYQKRYSVSRRFHAHVTGEPIAIGTRVRIVENRPLSRLKRWKVAEILDVAKASAIVAAEDNV